MTATVNVPLGAETTAKKWYLDVDTTPTGPSSTWLKVQGIINFTPVTDDAGLQDDSDYDSGGAKSQAKTTTGFSATCSVARKVLPANATQYDPGQEYLRTNSIGKVGLASVVHVRFYEMEPGGPRVEAYAGWATVSWAEQGGATDALSTAQITLTGRGQLASISHPDTAAAVVPVVGSVTPSALAAAGGDLVTIRGTSFTGATAVAFGATAATHFTVLSDSLVSAVAPAHTAATVAVSVTNAVGVSTVTQNVTYS